MYWLACHSEQYGMENMTTSEQDVVKKMQDYISRTDRISKIKWKDYRILGKRGKDDQGCPLFMAHLCNIGKYMELSLMEIESKTIEEVAHPPAESASTSSSSKRKRTTITIPREEEEDAPEESTILSKSSSSSSSSSSK